MKYLGLKLALAIVVGSFVACSSDDSGDDYWNEDAGGSGGTAATGGSGGTAATGGSGGTAGTGGGNPTGGSGGGSSASNIVADHSSVAAFEQIPSSFVDQAKSQFRILYGQHLPWQPDHDGNGHARKRARCPLRL